MVCSLCLREIEKEERTVEVDGRIRHESCSLELEQALIDLEKIYDDTCPKDI